MFCKYSIKRYRIMSLIIPISQLQDNPFEVSRNCHAQHEPIFVTKDGYGDMVIMSFDDYEELKIKADKNSAMKKIVESQAVPSIDDSVDTKELDKVPEREKNQTEDSDFEKIPVEDVIKILKDQVDRNRTIDKKY